MSTITRIRERKKEPERGSRDGGAGDYAIRGRAPGKTEGGSRNFTKATAKEGICQIKGGSEVRGPRTQVNRENHFFFSM